MKIVKGLVACIFPFTCPNAPFVLKPYQYWKELRSMKPNITNDVGYILVEIGNVMD